VALGQRVLVLAKKGEDPKQVAEQLGQKQGQAAVAKAAARPAEAAATSAPAPVAVGSNGESTAPAEVRAEGGRVKSTPLARKIAQQAGIEIASVVGSGPGGRIVRDDVVAHLSRKPSAPPAPRTAGAPAPAPRVIVPAGQARRVPHTPMRKTIAKRMAESALSVPVIHLTVDVRLDRLMAVREDLNSRLAAEKVKLSVGDFATKAVALALRQHPLLNASFEPEAVVLHGDVNVGIAVAIEGGLMVPVLHHADQLGLKEIRQGTEALANGTRAGALKPNQMMGATFTISNLGMYGVKHFDAIINLPEVAILAVGAAEKRPVVEGQAIVVGTVMTLTLTADHRVVDGATAAEFMRTVKGFLEEPATMLL
jgi:pyruvate dehydrogenase E2 component (dihydrolipoamide acetyltransferase)